MVLLLQSPSEVARLSIAEKIVKERGDWRHIPVERIGELMSMEENPLAELFQGEDMQLLLACQCAQKLKQEEGLHAVMTIEQAGGSVEDMRNDLGEGFYAVHVGEDDADAATCDYIIDGSKSVNEVYTLLQQLIEAVEEQEQGKKKKKK